MNQTQDQGEKAMGEGKRETRAPFPSESEDPRVARALEEYLAALETGPAPARDEFLERHSEIADVLAECLDGLEFIRGAAAQARQPMAPPPAVSAPDVQPEQPLGDYRIVREVGRGGMGVVYEAVQLSLGRRVALKVLPFAAALDAKQLQRFKNEAQAAAHLHHTHIVPVHAVGCERGVHYYAMQFIEGQTLAALIAELRQQTGKEDRGSRMEDRGSKKLEAGGTIEDRGPANETKPGGPRSSILDPPSSFFRTVANLGVQAAEALEHAHQLGVIHRDIKPANLLVDAGGRLWITDFGLAHCQSQPGLTMTGDVVGTLRYMSPEQALAKRATLDARTDVYSLGATLYELLTLEPAYNGRNREEVLRQIAFEEPRPPSRLNKAVPAELETIVLKALAKNPDERYATAQDVADDLQRFLDDKPIRAKRPTLWQRAKKWARRHRAVAVAVAVSTGVLLLMAVAALAVSTVMITREQQQTKEALRELARKAYFQNILLASENLPDWRTPRLERLLTECPPQLRGWEWHYLQRALDADALEIPGGPDLAFSPDDHWLAAPSHHDIKVWDTESGQEVFTCHGHTGRVFRVAFSPQGRQLASASEDTTVRLWDLSGAGAPPGLTPRFTLPGHGQRVLGLAFSPDGRRLASASADLTVCLWDTAAGQKLHRFPGLDTEPGLLGRTYLGLAFSPDGRHLAAGHAEQTVRVWDAVTGRAVSTLRGHTAPVVSVVYSPDGHRLASVGEDNTLRIWDLTAGREVFRVGKVINSGPAAMFSPDSRLVAVTHMWEAVRVYDVGSGQEVQAFRGKEHPPAIFGVAMSPNGLHLATAANDQRVRVWDLQTGQEVIALRCPTPERVVFSGFPERVLFSHDSTLLASASTLGGTVRIWNGRPADVPPDPPILCLRGHTDRVRGVAFSPDGQHLATASHDHTIRIWDAANGQELRTLIGHTDFVTKLAFHPDGRWFASTSDDESVKIWEVATGQELHSFARGGGGTIAFSPDGRRLAVNKGLAVDVLDSTTGQQLLSLAGHEARITGLAFSPDGKYLASSGHDKKALVRDASTGELLHTLRHPAMVGSLAFSPDSRQLVCGYSGNMRLCAWDPATGRELRQLFKEGRSGGAASSVSFSPDGRQIASGHLRKVILWDATTGQEIQTYRGCVGWVRSVAFSPDGQRLAAAGGDAGRADVRVWHVPPWRPKVGPGEASSHH